jgi:ribosome biogenesis protein Tsr3
LSDTYVLTAFELSKQMVAKSHEVDEALAEMRDAADLYPQAYKVMLRQTSEKFLTAKGATIKDRESLVNLECSVRNYDSAVSDHRRDHDSQQP